MAESERVLLARDQAAAIVQALTGQSSDGLQVIGVTLAEEKSDGLADGRSVLNGVGLAGGDGRRGAGDAQGRGSLGDDAGSEGESANDGLEEAHGGCCGVREDGK